MLAAFRTDASTRIGTGHVMRCLTLAHAIRRGGGEARFFCRELDGNLAGFLRDQGMGVDLLPKADSVFADPSSPPHASWLEADWRLDAEQVSRALAGSPARPDWLILDHYALDARWESSLRPYADRILVVDDLADRDHDCDALLDQNLYPDMETRYSARIPAGARQLLGPGFALLREEFSRARAGLRRRDGSVGRILIFFGGADPDNLTSRALEAWFSLGRGDIAVDVVVGPANPHRFSIESLCFGRSGVSVHVDTRDMASLMSAADLSLGAGGTATWERCALALPTLCISIAGNQIPVARAAAERGLLDYIGHHDAVTASAIASSLELALGNPAALEAMAAVAGGMVDGQGAERVRGALANLPGAKSPEGKESLRPARAGDSGLYYAWANDFDVRKNSFNPAAIAWEDHTRWFAAKLAAPASALFVLELDGRPAGQIRFDAGTEGIEIDFSVDKDFRGKGLAAILLSRGTDAYRARGVSTTGSFLGVVKSANAPSARAFRAAGFAAEGTREIKGEPCLVFRKRL